MLHVSGKNHHARLVIVVEWYVGQTKAMIYLDFIDDVNGLTANVGLLALIDIRTYILTTFIYILSIHLARFLPKWSQTSEMLLQQKK